MTAIYGRQSVDKGEQSLSIESQIEECQKRVPSGEAVEIYHDRGFSGSHTGRPDFTRLMNDVQSGAIQRLIVWKLDRISRSLLDFANILAIFETKKVAFDSVTEQLDTTSPMGRAMINIIMVFAQLERETIQMRIAANYQKRAERGFFLGGPATFGLVKKPVTVNGYKTGMYELCPEYGHTLLVIFEKYADSLISLSALARYLNGNGHTTPNGILWSPQKLAKILQNPTYVMSDADIYRFYKAKGANIISPVEDFAGNGLYLYGKREHNGSKFANIPGHSLAVALHKGFIDSAAFLKVQYRFAENVKIGKTGTSQLIWLSGFVKCGLCGFTMSSHRKRDHIVLRCARYLKIRDCTARSIRASIVETYVWDALLIKLEELRGVAFARQTKRDSAQNQIKIELLKTEEQIDRLVTALAEGNAPASITKRIQDLETRQAELLTSLQREKAKALSIDTDKLLELVGEDLTLEEKKAVAKAMILRVTVKPDETPVMDWLF